MWCQLLNGIGTVGKIIISHPPLFLFAFAGNLAVAQVPRFGFACCFIATQRTLNLCADVAHLDSLKLVRFGIGLKAELDAVLSGVINSRLLYGLGGIQIDWSTISFAVIQGLVTGCIENTPIDC